MFHGEKPELPDSTLSPCAHGVGWMTTPKIHILKPYFLVPKKVSVFRDMLFKEVIHLKWGA